MTKHIHKISLLGMAILVAIVVGFSSCKSQKKLTEVSDSQDVAQAEDEPKEDSEEKSTVIKETNTRTIAKEERLNNYFGAIATASSLNSANASIQEALTMFSTSEAPVLIVIYKAGSQPDYDEPTTISKYLNYLKDTKNNNALVEEAVYDTNGKIKELVLKK